MKQKLKETLTALQTISARFDALDPKMDCFKERLTALEFKLSNRCDSTEIK